MEKCRFLKTVKVLLLLFSGLRQTRGQMGRATRVRLHPARHSEVLAFLDCLWCSIKVCPRDALGYYLLELYSLIKTFQQQTNDRLKTTLSPFLRE